VAKLRPRVELHHPTQRVQIFKTTTIENGLRHALATGNWGIKTGATQGVSQVLSRYSYLATRTCATCPPASTRTASSYSRAN
jgi:DNA-directed RNA polymerase beta subunit